MPDPRATAIARRLAALFPELAKQLQGEEVARVISEELGKEERSWTYLPELTPVRGWYEATSRHHDPGVLSFDRVRKTWKTAAGSLVTGVYARRRAPEPAPLTPEALAYLESQL